MSSLINRIQRAFLGSAGEAKVRALLAELQIPADGSGQGDMDEVRRGFLRPISHEGILRDALANLGLSGGGSGARPVNSVRAAVLRNWGDSAMMLRDALNDLLEPGDLASGGGSTTPDWVPTNAAIHIDFLGGDPQGRAWSNGAEVMLETLLGFYDPESFTEEEGYTGTSSLALLGDALALVLAGATFTLRFIHDSAAELSPSVIMFRSRSADTSDGVEVDVSLGANTDPLMTTLQSYQGPLYTTQQPNNFNDGVTAAINILAITFTSNRLETSLTGSTPFTAALVDADRPAANPFVEASVRGAFMHGITGITFYDPLPNTTGLSELSTVA